MFSISGIFIVTDVIKSTKTKAFSSLKKGDKMEFSLKLNAVGTSRGHSYAPHLKCENLQTGEINRLSLNQLDGPFNCFSWEKVLDI